jgi:hypothetical protein
MHTQPMLRVDQKHPVGVCHHVRCLAMSRRRCKQCLGCLISCHFVMQTAVHRYYF